MWWIIQERRIEFDITNTYELFSEYILDCTEGYDPHFVQITTLGDLVSEDAN